MKFIDVGKVYKIVWYGLVLYFMLHASSARSQDYTAAQNKIKAIYVYNFMKYIQWPHYSKDGEMKICAFADEGIYKELAKLAASRKINNRVITVELVNSLNTCDCDLVFIANKNLAGELSPSDGCTGLVITDGEPVQNLSNITLLYKDQKLNFEIDEELCKKQGYFVAAKLRELAL